MSEASSFRSICDVHVALDQEVRRFMENVGDAKEESITDYLVWKWRELDKRFHYLRVQQFNHDEESSITGADFDLELWLVRRQYHIALAVQAKKVLKRANAYVTQLRYPRGTKGQITSLLSYAASMNRRPFYFIYSLPESNQRFMCGGRTHEPGAVFTADARVVEEYADGKHGRRVTRDQLLEKTNPFYCMFCCPLVQHGTYFEKYFERPFESRAEMAADSLPSYVQRLLEQGNETASVDQSEAPKQFRLVGVYDMREG